MNELTRTALMAEQNVGRFYEWRVRYFLLFNRIPDGDIRAHRRCLVIDDVKRLLAVTDNPYLRRN